MSSVISYSVGNGDMFTINHNTPNFTIIDCCINDDREMEILESIVNGVTGKEVIRFISTHPDDDHLRGIDILDDALHFANFYCVRNSVSKNDDTDSFKRYCQLRDSDKAFYVYKNCARKWLNRKSEERGSAGLSFLWPDINNQEFKEVLASANKGESPNNISPIVQYNSGSANFLWMGDLETDFLESIEESITIPKVSVLFAPHHGRDSGKIPDSILTKMNPQIVVVGEALSQFLNYYDGYNTITQNSAGDIVFECRKGKIHIFTSNGYEVEFLENEQWELEGYNYIGSLDV